MVRLVLVFFVALCLSAHADDPLFEEVQGNGIYQTSDYAASSNRTESLRARWTQGGMDTMARDVNKALGGLMGIAARNLRYRGYTQDATDMEQGWREMDGEVIRLAKAYGERRITDYQPLSTYLAIAYMILEEKLGYDICRALRLDLICTFNYTIKYIFTQPCAGGEAEFFSEFVHDDPTVFHPYEGLAPATSYVLTTIGCDVATFGAGVFWICGPIGMLVEFGMNKVVAPKLSPVLFNRICN